MNSRFIQNQTILIEIVGCDLSPGVHVDTVSGVPDAGTLTNGFRSELDFLFPYRERVGNLEISEPRRSARQRSLPCDCFGSTLHHSTVDFVVTMGDSTCCAMQSAVLHQTFRQDTRSVDRVGGRWFDIVRSVFLVFCSMMFAANNDDASLIRGRGSNPSWCCCTFAKLIINTFTAYVHADPDCFAHRWTNHIPNATYSACCDYVS